ncbi:Wzz/FepE/Etk N-terminal domain-containing protein, partial [Roseisolibacter sp. H3M3-2]|uniref:GumC family protein n=1 Tax=Roseisolibacter sp. H3M3-2 TaxID=3031323 RepID=UPI0023DB7C62
MSGTLVPSGRGALEPLPGATRTVAAGADVVDVGELVQGLRRGWRGIALAALLGVAAAGAVLAWAPRRYEGAATVLLRSAQDAGGSLLGRLGVPAELAPGGLGSALKSPMETELEILASNSVIGRVSDSLGLQVRVLSPAGRAPWTLLAPRAYAGSFRKVKLTFEREGAGYRVRGRGVDGVVSPAAPLTTSYGTLALAPGALPPAFEVQLLDREDALERLRKRVGVDKTGGEVASVAFAAPDSLSAAAVPNAIVEAYLQRRRTTDRGVNQHRAEFVSAQVDSVSRQLAAAEQALREYQERSGVVDPKLVGEIDLEAASKVRELLAANAVEGVALDQLLRQVGAGSMSARQLAAYPSFLRSGAVNELLAQLAKLETERAELLERRTEADPEVVALTQRASDLERQLQPLGAAYAQSLERQRAELQSQASRFEASLETLPASAQEFARREREVRRLAQTGLALQTQLLDARLAAIGEGGEVRQIDDALVPKKAAFPRPVPTLAAGLGGGAVVGVLLVLGVAFFSPRVAGPTEAARLVGAPATTIGAASPLFVAMVRRQGAFTVVPLDDAAAGEKVARWLAGPASTNGSGAHAAVLAAEPEPAAV